MCAQFLIRDTLKDLAIRFGAEIPFDFEYPSHVFPKYPAPVIVLREQKRWLAPMSFGFIPFFEKSEKPKSVFHNARSETVFEKPSFRREIITNRCLVPLSSFIEPTRLEVKGKVVWWRFDLQDPDQWLAAGVWSIWKTKEGDQKETEREKRTFAILTADPYPEVEAKGHDRSPLFLKKDAWAQFLDKNTSLSELKSILNLNSGSSAERKNKDAGPILISVNISK